MLESGISQRLRAFDSGSWRQGEGGGGNEREAEGGERPPAVALRWERFFEFAFSGLDGDGFHRRFTQPGRECVGVSLLILKLDDA